ncbi:hypothetical protein WG936_05385 [Corynebacterium sp. H127]|uniref:hypothetical protein n=1 Tax=Corynebacterium sp. H127 TaxID=3133418 RepID=UPI00309C016A
MSLKSETIPSKVIVYASELQQALKAACKVAGKKDLETVRIEIMPDIEQLRVYAMSHESTIEIRIPTTMIDLVHQERDRLIEITAGEAKRIVAMGSTAASGLDDELPQIGLIITEPWINATDETGHGRRTTQVARLAEPRLPGDPSKAVARAIESKAIDQGFVHADQWKLVSAVASVMGHHSRLITLDAPDPVRRILLIGHSFALTSTHGHEAQGAKAEIVKITPANPPKGAA